MGGLKLMHVLIIGNKYSLVLGDNFQIFCQFEQTKTILANINHFKFDPDETSQDYWEDCS